MQEAGREKEGGRVEGRKARKREGESDSLEEEVRNADEVDGVLEHLEAFDGQEDNGVDGEADGRHVVERRDRVEAKALEQLLHEDEPARLDADGEGLWRGRAGISSMLGERAEKRRATHLDEEAPDLEVELAVAREGDAERDERDDEENLARELLEAERRRDEEHRDGRKRLRAQGRRQHVS